MRFKALRVKHVRGILSAELDFGPGLNVLHGPNDIGKSTLVAAMRAALLLQYSSAEGQTLAPWAGDFVPEVELSFEREPQQLWRVRKTFGVGARGSARLERSRDGVEFSQEATARQVEDKLRGILKWGVASPGGKNRQVGLPRPFLAQALLGEQADVVGILEASLEGDGTDSGRARLTAALEAFAQDPRFKAISLEVQKQVDRFFTTQGNPKRGKDSPFKDATAEIAQLRERLEELQKQKQSSDSTVAHLAELRKELEAQGHARELARAKVEAISKELKAGQARVVAAAALEQAAAALAGVDARIERAEVKAAEVGALSAAQAGLGVQHEKVVAATAAAAVELEQAKKAWREASSDKASAARALKKATLITEAAADDAEAAKVARERQLAEEARQKALALANHRSALEAKRVQLQRVEEEIARAEQEAADARLMHARLLAAYGYARWQECAARVERARGAREAAGVSTAQAAEARKEAAQLKAEVEGTPVPPPAELAELVELERRLQLAEAALGGGLSLTIRAAKALKLTARTDGGREQKLAGTEATLEALRTIALSIPGVAELEVSAGDEANRKAVEQLRLQWAAARPALERAGVTTTRALQELREKVDARAREAEARLQAAVQLEKDAGRQREEASGLAALEAQARSYQAGLEGHDQAMLAGLAARLPGSAGDPATTREAKELGAAVTRAQASAAASRTAKAGLEGQLLQLEAHVEEAEAAGVEAARALEGREPAAVLAGLGAKEKELAARRATREAYVSALESWDGQEGVAAQKAVDGAEARLKEAQQAQAASQKQLEERRTRLDLATGELGQLRKEAAAADRPGALAEVAARKAALEALPAVAVTVEERDAAVAVFERAEQEFGQTKDALRGAEGALSQVGGAVVSEQVEDYSAALVRAQERQADLEADAHAWSLLRTVLRECESVGARHLGAALGQEVSARFQQLAGDRYGGIAIDPHLKTLGVQAAGERRVIDALSAGTRDQVATLLRLAIAESLGSVVVLDDHLVQSDPVRLGWFVGALKAAAEKIQVIVVTCRRRDYEAGAGEGVTWIDLGEKIQRGPGGSRAG